MNTTKANRYTSALNRIAEGATMLAQIFEELAWESFEDHPGMLGTRPIAAARLAQPDQEASAGTPETTGQQAQPVPAPVEDPVVEPVTLEQVRGVLAALSQAGHTARVRELIRAAGADKLSEIDPAKYGWLLSQAEVIADA